MKPSRALALIGVAAAMSAGASAAQAASWLTVGPSDLCGSDGCFGASKTFIQTYSAAGRSGVVDIGSLAILRDIMGASSQAVKVSFVMADGTELTWGKFTLAALGSNVVRVAGKDVAWDTSLGDLTVKLDLIVPDKGGAGGGLGGGGVSLGPPQTTGGAAPFEFDDVVQGGPLVRPALPPQSVVAVPEPGAWGLMILGFGSAGAVLRRRKALHRRYA